MTLKQIALGNEIFRYVGPELRGIGEFFKRLFELILGRQHTRLFRKRRSGRAQFVERGDGARGLMVGAHRLPNAHRDADDERRRDRHAGDEGELVALPGLLQAIGRARRPSRDRLVR